MQAIEKLEDPVVVMGGNADPVVGNGQDRGTVLQFCGDRDFQQVSTPTFEGERIKRRKRLGLFF